MMKAKFLRQSYVLKFGQTYEVREADCECCWWVKYIDSEGCEGVDLWAKTSFLLLNEKLDPRLG